MLNTKTCWINMTISKWKTMSPNLQLIAWIPLTVSYYQSLLAITLCKFFRLYLVSIQSWWMSVFIVQPTQVGLCIEVHSKMLVVSLYLFLQQCQHVLLGLFARSGKNYWQSTHIVAIQYLLLSSLWQYKKLSPSLSLSLSLYIYIYIYIWKNLADWLFLEANFNFVITLFLSTIHTKNNASCIYFLFYNANIIHTLLVTNIVRHEISVHNVKYLLKKKWIWWNSFGLLITDSC